MFHAPLPDRLIHIHGALFTGWMFLLIAQTSLVAAGKVNIHRRLGIAACVMACVMVVFGELAAIDSLVRRAGPPGRDPQMFFMVPFTEILLFGVLMLFAFRARKDSAAHKRLIMIATTALVLAAVARWPMFHRSNPLGAAITSWIFLLLIAALRSVDHPPIASRYHLGQRLPDLRATGPHAHCENRGLALLRRMGADRGRTDVSMRQSTGKASTQYSVRSPRKKAGELPTF